MSAAPPAVADLTAALKRAWRAGTPPDAAGAVRAHPSLLADRSLVVELAYEEYCLREEAGSPPDPSLFVRRFPAYRSHIREVLDGHRLLADHPELFAPAANWPEAGAEVHGLVVQAELGRGAFARAYLARDPETGDRPVVLKLAPGRTAEGKTLGGLAHPNIVSVLWAKQADGMQAVCMPYAGAATLRDAVEGAFVSHRPTARAVLEAAAHGPPPAHDPPAVVHPNWSYPRAVAAVFARLADAVAHLHRHKVAHGDLKPSNVLLAPGGHPYLIDFNLAAAGGPADALRRGGTLPYMPPELLRTVAGGPAGAVDAAAADVFAFGAVLFEALAGRVPLEPMVGVEPPVAAADLLARQPSRPPATTAAGVPRRLARLIDHCLDPDPARRPEMPEVLRELSAYEAAPARRRRAAVALAVGLGLVGLVGAGVAAALAAVADPDPATPDGRFERGLKRLRQGDVSGAGLDFEFLRKTQNDGRSHAYAGYCQQLLGQPRIAMELYRTAVDRHGYTPPWVRSNFAYCLVTTGDYRKQAGRSVAEAEAAVRAAPDARPARLVRGRARYMERLTSGQVGPADPALVRDVEAAVTAPGGESRAVYRMAALVRLAFSDRREADLTRAVHWLREAVRTGLSSDTLSREVFLIEQLGHRQDFGQLLTTPVAPVLADEPDLYIWPPPMIADTH